MSAPHRLLLVHEGSNPWGGWVSSLEARGFSVDAVPSEDAILYSSRNRYDYLAFTRPDAASLSSIRDLQPQARIMGFSKPSEGETSSYSSADATIIGILASLEALGPISGHVLFRREDQALGFAFIDGGKLCVVGGTHDHRRLGEILLETNPEARASIRDAVSRAQVKGTPFGVALVEAHPELREQLGTALKTQIVTGLRSIVRDQKPFEYEVTTVERNECESCGAIRFTHAEILLFARRRAADAANGPAAALYREFVEKGTGGALFRREGLSHHVLTAHGIDAAASVLELRELASSVRSLLYPPPFVAAGIRPHAIALGGPEGDAILFGDAGGSAVLCGLGRVARSTLLAKVATLRDESNAE